MKETLIIQGISIVIMILLSAFFSSAETAFTAVNPISIKSLAEEENKRAKLLLQLLGKPAKVLSTILVGNNIVNISAATVTTSFTVDLLGNTYIGIMTGVLTLLVLLFGEITPKTYASLHAQKVALKYAPVINFLIIILRPIVIIVEEFAKILMLALKIKTTTSSPTITELELRTMVNVGQETGVILKEEKKMIDNVLDFGDSKAWDVMIPRIDMTFVDVNTSYDDLLQIFKEDKHTRFPVYEDDTDNVIGIINIKDLLLVDNKNEFSIKDILRTPYFTYEQKPTGELLLEMRKDSVNLAIVVDEYGATSGLVTLEDLLEEIVGEIRDEYDMDEEEEVITVIPNREYVASGSAKLDTINETLGLDLESEDYDSIGGYIIEKLDSFPTDGQVIYIDNEHKLVVDEIKKNRINKVHIWFLDEDEQKSLENIKE